MLIEPIEILLDKPRKIRMGHRALFEAETKINQIRGASAFARVSIDYLFINGMNAWSLLKSPFPMDLLVALLWASLVPEEKRDDNGKKYREALSFEQVMDLLDQSQTPLMDIAPILFDAYCKAAGNSIKEKQPGETSAEDEKKTVNPETGSASGALPGSNLH